MPAENAADLQITARIVISAREFDWSFARSSGPGGQNVNKVNSKAILRWRPYDCPTLPPDVLQRFLARYGSRLTTAGEIVIESEEFRDQPKNIERCREKLREWLASVARPPRVRKPTKPSAGSHRRRLAGKKLRSDVKQSRRAPDAE